MARRRKQESWEHPAAELVRLLTDLLDSHWSAIRDVLELSMGEDRANAHLRQLDHLRRALQHELWLKGNEQPSRKIAGAVGVAALAALTGLTGKVGANAGDEIYGAIRGAEKTAQEVVVLVEAEGARDDSEPTIQERLRVAQQLADRLIKMTENIQQLPMREELAEYINALRDVMPSRDLGDIARLNDWDIDDPADRDRLRRLSRSLNEFIQGTSAERGVMLDRSDASG